MNAIKALSLWNPWAALWACGAKEFETRSWSVPNNYRGPIAIHAASISISRVLKQVFPLWKWSYAPDYEAKRIFLEAARAALNIDNLNTLPLGCIIATAELVGCHKIVLHGGRGLSSTSPGWLETDRGIYEPTEQELLFGDWTPGRYAWEPANIIMLPEPIPTPGKQGLWNWTPPEGVRLP
jgi:hypothetical protein